MTRLNSGNLDQVPTALISFGYLFYLYDAPRVPTDINAYGTYDCMQEAVREAPLGTAPAR